jgi:hypothetical protein
MKSNKQMSEGGLRFPFWQYFTQPMFDAAMPPILNPRRFYYFYRVQYLERCWFNQCQSENRPNWE